MTTQQSASEEIIAIVPARLAASRFPGKPLALIHGRPMIEHVMRRVALCDRLNGVYVATCDEEIRHAVERFGGKVIMTSAAHQRASDRVAEAAEHVEAGIVVMVQGDEPMIVPEMIDAAVAPMLADHSIYCVNLARRISSADEYLDPNTIKVVMDVAGNALFFSRTPIPTVDRGRIAVSPVFKQVCVIPFRRDFLRKYARLSPTPLEREESIDMLRILEHGGHVRMVETEWDTHAVDTPDDLRLVERRMADDPLIQRYESGSVVAGRT